MKTVSGIDPLARYKNVYRAEFGGKSVMVAGITVIQAAEEAAMYFGISMEAFRESGVLVRPSAQETLSHCKRFKKTAEMLVKNPRYGEATVTALCREDAVMQAAALLEAPIAEMFSEHTTVRLTGRIKSYSED